MSASAMMLVAAVLADGPQCKTFREIYQNGENLCNKMWGDAFVYTREPEPAYSMWWADATTNPNKAVTKKLHEDGQAFDYYDAATNEVGDCLDSMHVDVPQPHAELGKSVCWPWKSNACCEAKTVATGDTLNEAYGAQYHWDRCGTLSEQCRQFFIYEACLYECEPAASLFRKHSVHPNSTDPNKFDPTNDAHNKWELFKMPIKATECDSWYDACADDLFCSSDDGNYFTCAKEYLAADADSNDDSLAPGWIAVIVVLCVLFCIVACYLAYVITREKQGKPVYYQPVAATETPHGPDTEMKAPTESAVGEDA